MKRLNIDFVARPRWSLPAAARSRALLIILAVLGLIAVAALAWQVRQLDRQIAEVERALDLARHELAARTPLSVAMAGS